MTRIVVVHGPMACGKTRNKDALMRALGCNHVYDGWDGIEQLYRAIRWSCNGDVPVGDWLILTSHPTPQAPAGTKVLPFGEAMRIAGLDN